MKYFACLLLMAFTFSATQTAHSLGNTDTRFGFDNGRDRDRDRDRRPHCRIEASPSVVSWGSRTTLSWESQNARSAVLEPAGLRVSSLGSQSVLTLVNGTEYTLRVEGPQGTATCSTWVKVVDQPPSLGAVVDASRLGLAPTIASNYVQGPIVIEGQNNVTISGKHIYNHNGPCIIVRNSSNVRISRNSLFECGKHYASADGVIVNIENSSYVTVDYNYFSDGGPNSIAIYGTNNAHVNIAHNHFYFVSGGVSLWNGTAQNVVYNRFLNMRPRAGVPSGFVQFVKAYGGLNTIACNTGSNDSDHVPQTGDLINVYQSSGIATSPIQVYGNKLIGTGTNLQGDGLASAGNQIGDGSFSAHIKVYFNQLVNVNSGIQVTGGETVEVYQNQVFAGARAGYYTSGISAVNFYGVPGQHWTMPGACCRNVKIYKNNIHMPYDSRERALMLDFESINGWPNCQNVADNNNDIAAILDASIVNGNPAPGCSEL